MIKFKKLVLIFLLSLWTVPLYAGLSVQPFDGANSLNFAQHDRDIELTKEVRVSVTGSPNVQYQIFQRIEGDLINESGESLGRSVIEVSTLPGSNSTGTLYLQGVEKIGFADQLVYTSTSSGLPDSFTLIYKLNRDQLTKHGHFSGRIVYTLRPFGAGNQDQIILNVFIESSGELQFEVKPSRGNHLRLSSKTKEETEDHLKISFSDGGQRLKVFQEVLTPLTNEQSQEFDSQGLQFFVAGETNGETDYTLPSFMLSGRQLIYAAQTPSDSFEEYFRLNPDRLAEVKAGSYRGRIKIDVESDRPVKSDEVDIEVEIKPVFDLQLNFPEGEVKFSKLLATMPPQYQEVVVHVHSNLGKPYSVIQNVDRPLANEKGEELDAKHFSYKQEILEGKSGRAEATDFKTVELGSSPIFFSDEKGSSTEFKVIYRLEPYQNMKPGDYAAAIIFSLSEL
jgi:hypothetical protein